MDPTQLSFGRRITMSQLCLSLSCVSGGKMSIFLMGVYDPGTFRWCTVTKCGNGLDDKMINRLQRELNVRKISKVTWHSLSLFSSNSHVSIVCWV